MSALASKGRWRFVGLAYLVGFVGDGALSMLLMAFPALEGASDAFTNLMLVFSAIVLVLSIIGRLKPRVLFLVPVAFYAALGAMGVALFVAVTVKTGGKKLPDDFGLPGIVGLFPWFGTVNWVVITLGMMIGTVCLYRFVRTLTEEDEAVGRPGGPSLQFWICPQCHRHVPARLSACRCGFSRPDAGEVQFTSPAAGAAEGASASGARPRPIWSPNTACNWSCIYSPAFGAYIHAQNWKTLNEPQRARWAMVWFYVSLGMIGITLALHFLGVGAEVVGDLGVLYLGIWYFAAGRAQVGYVKEKYGQDYPRRPWGKPLTVAGAAIVAYFAFVVVLVVVAGLIKAK